MLLEFIDFAIKGMSMSDNVNGVRGEVSEYTWGRLWSDGTREFNNGAIQYADGSLEFDGLTFYPDGVVIDASGQQVGLIDDTQLIPSGGEGQGAEQSLPDESAEGVKPEEVEEVLTQTHVGEGEGEALIIEDETDVESYLSLDSDER
ncbi:hypothetical protein KW846_16240 [Pseudomonas sp. PDM32]|uniref:hypothetical protein n=1 Tax=Pseudomonas sp. PDM32 TaxID=2854768 RepID=UPI001C481EEF|nr:hypothetical protein [Pseudomonas sp. PDM32]MBV7574249.1 hypothetical protein [Pseudomonas sp. PDM32]